MLILKGLQPAFKPAPSMSGSRAIRDSRTQFADDSHISNVQVI
jgi:hypothetical protein